MNHRIRTTTVAASVALGAGLLLSACQSDSGATDTAGKTTGNPAVTSSPTPASGATGASGSGGRVSRPAGTPTGASRSGGTTRGTGSGGTGSGGTGSGRASGDGRAGDKSGYGQSCGSKDLRWSAKSMTQAGGYIRISVSAKPGITCVLPAGLPVVAFGSGGTQAGPAEQSAGGESTLHGGTTVYAGVNPKITKDNAGAEYGTVIVSASESDPHPVSLSVGNTLVDKPVVTNWHTNPADAVPAA